MDLILSFTALMVSLATNVYLVKKLAGSMRVDVHLPTQQIEIFVPGLAPSERVESKSESVPVKNESHSAWVNRKGIPMNETNRSPSHGSKPPTAGPLERPAGFAR